MSHWRQEAARVIAGIEASYQDASVDDLRKHIAAAYPFGPRAHHPYRIWCDEQRKALARQAVRRGVPRCYARDCWRPADRDVRIDEGFAHFTVRACALHAKGK